MTRMTRALLVLQIGGGGGGARGRGEHVKIDIFNISSESSGPILIKLCMHVPKD